MVKVKNNRRMVCAICGKAKPPSQFRAVGSLRRGFAEALTQEHPGLTEDSLVCLEDLNRYRRVYLEKLITSERGELSALEREVIDAMARDQTLAENVAAEAERELSFGERTADKVADFGG